MKKKNNTKTNTTKTNNKVQMSAKSKLFGSLALIIFVAGAILSGMGNFAINAISGDFNINYKNSNDQPEPKYSFYDELSKRKSKINEIESKSQKNGKIKLESINASIDKSTDRHLNTATSSADSNKNDKSSLSNSKRSTYVVQIGAFKNMVDAEKLLSNAKNLGFSGKIVSQNNLYLIYIGNYNQHEAADAKEKLSNNGFQTLIKNLSQ